MTDRLFIVFGIFIVVLILTQILTAPLTSTSAQSRRRMRKRISLLANQQVVETEKLSLVRHSYLQNLNPFERWLESWPIFRPLSRLIDQAGIELPAYRVVVFSLVGAVASLALMPLLTKEEIIILGTAVLAGLGPWIWLRIKKSKRLMEFEETLPNALSMLARTMRAGLPLSQALQIVSQEMDGPVAKEFGIVFTELNYGGDLRSAFLAMLERIPSMTVMAMAVAIMIQKETGGNLAESVDELEKLMRERARFQRHLRTLTSSNRTSAWIVGLIPLILSFILELLSPGHISTIFKDPTGIKLLYFVLGLQVIGVLWIRKIIRLDV